MAVLGNFDPDVELHTFYHKGLSTADRETCQSRARARDEGTAIFLCRICCEENPAGARVKENRSARNDPFAPPFYLTIEGQMLPPAAAAIRKGGVGLLCLFV